MEKQLDSLNRLILQKKENINGNEIAVYSLAVVGFAFALRRVRPFARFTRPSDIPIRFIRSRTKLNGTVERIEPGDALLMVQHQPIIRLLRTKVDSLPVKISGVTVNGNGISWLQTIVSGNNVSFIPVLKQKDCVQCEVMMEQKNKQNNLDIGPTLISIGFGKVNPIEKTLSSDSFYKTYYSKLQQAELAAERKKLKHWYYVKILQQFSQRLAKLILSSILPKPKAKTTKVDNNPKVKSNKLSST